MRQHRTKLIGVSFTAGQEFHADLVDGVYVAAEELGYDVVLSGVTPHRDEHRALRTLVDDRCEGLVLIGPEMPTRELGELAARVPVVVVARRVRGVDAVRSDDAAGAVMGIDHLRRAGASPDSVSSMADAHRAPPSDAADTVGLPGRRSYPN